MAAHDRVEAWLVDIGNVVQEDAFVKWNSEFVDKNCDKFDEQEEENKLEYTSLFEEYIEGVEKHIEEGMKGKSSDFSMEQLMEALPEFVKAPDSAPNMHSAKAVDLLMGLAEFQTFKSAMILAKKDKHQSASDVGKQVFGKDSTKGAADGTDLETLLTENEEKFAGTEGWSRIVDKGWLVLEKKADPTSTKKYGNLSRIAITLDLDVEDARTIYMDFSERRKGWDKNMKSCTVHKTYPGRGMNRVITMKVDHPYLIKLMGIPDSFTLRILERVDFPNKGDFTYVIAPWDLEKDAVDHANKWLNSKSGILRPHPTEPGKTISINNDSNNLGWMPEWISKTLVNTLLPRQVVSLVDSYKKYKQSVPDFQTLTLTEE